MTIEMLAEQVIAEVRCAERLHPPMNSAHEAYAVILEELDEFWEEVRKKRDERDEPRIRRELTQVAAMAIRAIHDLKF